MKHPKRVMTNHMSIRSKKGTYRYMNFIKKHGDPILACVPAFIYQYDDCDSSESHKNIDFFVTMPYSKGDVNHRMYLAHRNEHNLD